MLKKFFSTLTLYLLLTSLLCPAILAGTKDKSLLLRYDFDEGSGTVAKDKSGNGLNGQVVGAKYVRQNKGYALEFDGSSCVRVANSEILNKLGKPGVSYTVEFKFKSFGGHNNLSLTEKWPKSIVSYPWAIRGPFPDGTINFIIYDAKKGKLSRASYTHPVLVNRKWHHLAAVRDMKKGKVLLYIDGVPGRIGSDKLKKIDISNNGEICIGARNYSTSVDKGNITCGMIGQLDNVRIYNRALSAKEIERHSGASELPEHRDIQSADTTVKFKPISPALTLKKGEITVKASSMGSFQVDTGADSYVLKSCFSYPGAANKIGWNGLPRKFNQPRHPVVKFQKGAETFWKPVVKRLSADTISVTAHGRYYKLERTVKIENGKLDFTDKVTNLRKSPTGIIIRHGITANKDFLKRFNVGLEIAANPTVFLKSPKRSVALVMNDKFSRDRIRAALGSSRNHSGVQLQRFALAGNKSYTFSWSLYIMKKGQGYFDFINRLRKDWKSSFTIDGPFTFAYLKYEGKELKFYIQYSSKVFSLSKAMNDPAEMKRLREYLKWRGTKIIALAPWLDFDPGAMDYVFTWKQFRDIMLEAMPVIRKASPQVKLIGAIETDFVSFRRENIKHGELIPLPDRSKKRGPSGNMKINPTVSKYIESSLPEWKDSFVRDSKGQLTTYAYYRGGKAIEEPALMLFPEVGNKRYSHYMKQLKFLVEDLGMDGVYCDDFVLGQIGSKRAYGTKWDGLSGRVDFHTGKVSGVYKDCSIAGAQARANIMNYVLSRNKIIVTNRHSTTCLEQPIPAFRFTETGWDVGPVVEEWEPGTKPPAINYMFFAHLNTALGLGLGHVTSDANRVEWMMKGLIIYLRHGMIFYHYNFKEPRMNLKNKNAFDVIKHMFPITPVELGEGFLVGKERILTAISMNRLWKKNGKPSVLIYDTKGNRVNTKGRFTIKPENGKWRINLKLKDWAEVAVVE